MNPTRQAVGALGCGALILCAGCQSNADETLSVEVWIEETPEIVVTMESGMIAGASDLAVDAEGQVYILDSQTRAIHVTDSTGQLVRTVGRAGQGPGELALPVSLQLYRDSVVVVDQGNQRFQSFDRSGEPLGSQPMPECAQGGVVPTLGPSGMLVRPTMGMEPELVVVCSREGEELARIGELLAPAPSFVDMQEMRRQILDGDVPWLLLNMVSPIVAHDGSVWLVLPAAHRVDRYDGERATTVTLQEPEFETVRAGWIAEAEEMEGGGVPGLRYILRARDVGGMLWVLTNTADAPLTKVVVLSRDGEMVARLQFTAVEGAGNFAVDLNGGWIYFYISDTAELVRVPLDVEAITMRDVALQ